MNALTGDDLIDAGDLSARSRRATARLPTPTPRTSRSPRSTALGATSPTASSRVAKPHRLLDPGAGPLIAVRLWILTRKTLGGLETDLSGRVLAPAASRCPGCTPPARSPASVAVACTATARSRERSSGGCLFSGRTAGRAVAQAVA